LISDVESYSIVAVKHFGAVWVLIAPFSVQVAGFAGSRGKSSGVSKTAALGPTVIHRASFTFFAYARVEAI